MKGVYFFCCDVPYVELGMHINLINISTYWYKILEEPGGCPLESVLLFVHLYHKMDSNGQPPDEIAANANRFIWFEAQWYGVLDKIKLQHVLSQVSCNYSTIPMGDSKRS